MAASSVALCTPGCVVSLQINGVFRSTVLMKTVLTCSKSSYFVLSCHLNMHSFDSRVPQQCVNCHWHHQKGSARLLCALLVGRKN
jgi:hypothetical protein